MPSHIKKGAQFLPMPTSVFFFKSSFPLSIFFFLKGDTLNPCRPTLEDQQRWWKSMLPKAFLWPTPCRKRVQVCCDSWHQDWPSSWAGLVPDSASRQFAPPSLSQDSEIAKWGLLLQCQRPGSVFAPVHICWPRSTKAIRNVWMKSYCLDQYSHNLPHFYVVTSRPSNRWDWTLMSSYQGKEMLHCISPEMTKSLLVLLF